jgi:zinc protease
MSPLFRLPIPTAARLFALTAFALLSLCVLVLPARAMEVQTVTSAKGVTAYLVSDSTLPIVTLDFTLPAGSITDPAGKRGLAYLASGLIDEGAGEYDSQAFREHLQDLAIELHFDAGRDTFSGTLKTTTENLDEAFRLLRLALTEPRFDAEPVERIRAQVLSSIRSEDEDPNTIAFRAWMKEVMGDHPYTEDEKGTADSVAAITADDLRMFMKTRLSRQDLSIGVAGDVDAGILSALLDETFGSLPEKADLPEVPKPVIALTGKTTVIERDIPQSMAVLGQKGLLREDPRWHVAYVLNYILGGGGFSSRLTEEVREKRGLAYSAYSYLYPFRLTGLWIAGTATQNARMGESLKVMRDEWRRMAEDGPTAEELKDAKTYLTGAWPLRFTSTEAVAGMLSAMRVNDLPPDYIDSRNAKVEAVTIEDIRKLAKELMDPDALTAVVVGKPEGV